MASLSYLPCGQGKSVRLLPDVMHWSSRSANDAMGNTFQDVSALIAHMRRLFKIETITGHFVVRSEGESRGSSHPGDSVQFPAPAASLHAQRTTFSLTGFLRAPTSNG